MGGGVRDGEGGADGAADAPQLEGRDPWLAFALRFGALAVLSEVVYYGAALDSAAFQAYLNGLARISGAIISWLPGGGGVSVRDAVISGDLFSVEIAQGCDAYRISALLCAAILAFSAPWKKKAWGVALGLVWLNALNFVRIVGLYFIGGLYHSQFQRSHELYFPTFLICMTLLAWILWVRWVTDEIPAH